MNIGILTSSRADFGIYLPLLNRLKNDPEFSLQIIAFGTHCSKFHGETVYEIRDSGFENIDMIKSMLASDDENSISTAYGLTVMKFAEYWSNHDYDLVFCLGDRFEMSAAVQAGIPFGVKFAHLHGGETTLGAIDNIYRHQITLASTYHFTSTEQYKKKVDDLVKSDQVYNVGALSLDGLKSLKLLSEQEFFKKYNIPNEPFILTTFHPETVNPQKNEFYAEQVQKALRELSSDFYIVVTMPNADTYGQGFRKAIKTLEQDLKNRMLVIENFGKVNYFSAMKYSDFLLGNTSSGIVEAASFRKYVVNVGNRQKGRARSQNVIDCAFEQREMVDAVKQVKKLGSFLGKNIYEKKNTSKNIVNVLKNV